MGTSNPIASSAGPIAWLSAHQAQRDVIDGLARYATWEQLWAECPRGDWLLGIADRIGVEHTYLVRAALASARVADAVESATEVLDLAEKWLDGKATAEEVNEAASMLERATAPDPASAATMHAAVAVGMGVVDRGVLASAPAAAVESIMLASIDCGLELAMKWAYDKTATAVRNALPWSLVAPCVERLEDRG